MRNACRVAAVLFCLSLTVSGLLFAQSDLGTISGFVKDPSGATIANTKVTIRNNRGVDRAATSNDSGYYVITNVPPGLYTVLVEASGFRRYESRDNKLDPSANLAIDVVLTVGSATETVEVSASAVQLQTESASVQQLATREQIDSLEINGRNTIFKFSPPITHLNMAGPPEARFVSRPRAARRSFTARPTNTCAIPFSMQTRGSEMRCRGRRT
jgi:Carboxypeptidase regulatory-like domain